MLEIRQENKNDYVEVYNVVKKAFETAEHSDGNEQDLVEALRKSTSFIPELSLVAVMDNKIVGYILLPEYQRQGIGKELIKRGHEIAKELGYHYSVVLGSEKYYPKFGYVPALGYGIKAPLKVADENFMAIELNYTDEKIEETVKYAEEFGI